MFPLQGRVAVGVDLSPLPPLLPLLLRVLLRLLLLLLLLLLLSLLLDELRPLLETLRPRDRPTRGLEPIPCAAAAFRTGLTCGWRAATSVGGSWLAHLDSAFGWSVTSVGTCSECSFSVAPMDAAAEVDRGITTPLAASEVGGFGPSSGTSLVGEYIAVDFPGAASDSDAVGAHDFENEEWATLDAGAVAAVTVPWLDVVRMSAGIPAEQATPPSTACTAAAAAAAAELEGGLLMELRQVFLSSTVIVAPSPPALIPTIADNIAAHLAERAACFALSSISLQLLCGFLADGVTL